MRHVFNTGRVPLVVGGHVVAAGEWADVPDNAEGIGALLDTEQLIEAPDEPAVDIDVPAAAPSEPVAVEKPAPPAKAKDKEVAR